MDKKIPLSIILAILNGTPIVFGSIIFDSILRTRLLNRRCDNDMDCYRLDFSKCNEQKYCECVDQFFTPNGTYCSPLVGGYCDDDRDCMIRNTICVKKLCKCKPNHALQSYHCLPSTLKNYCRDDYDCRFIYYTECINGACMCEKNYTLVDSTCLPLLGSFCVDNGPCAAPNSVCKENECQCVDGFIAASNNECVLNYLGKKCSHNRDCAGVKLAVCSPITRTCTCTSQQVSYNRRICLHVLGEDCVYDNDCSPRNSVCTNGKCQCKPSYVAYSDYDCFDEWQLEP